MPSASAPETDGNCVAHCGGQCPVCQAGKPGAQEAWTTNATYRAAGRAWPPSDPPPSPYTHTEQHTMYGTPFGRLGFQGRPRPEGCGTWSMLECLITRRPRNSSGNGARNPEQADRNVFRPFFGLQTPAQALSPGVDPTQPALHHHHHHNAYVPLCSAGHTTSQSLAVRLPG